MSSVSDIVDILRAILTSSGKKTPANVLLREYEDTTNEKIPLKSLKFKSFEDFLRSTNEFVLTKEGGNQIVVTPKLKKESLHLRYMTKSSSRNIIAPKPQEPQRKRARAPMVMPRRSVKVYQQHSNNNTNNKYMFNMAITKVNTPPRLSKNKENSMTTASRNNVTINNNNNGNVVNQNARPRIVQTPNIIKNILQNEKPIRKTIDLNKRLDRVRSRDDSCPTLQLMEYCVEGKYPPPKYTFFTTNKRVLCKVMVHDLSYTTYPNEYSTEDEARKAAALIAFTDLKSKMSSLLPICPYDQIKGKLVNLISAYTHGVFVPKVPDLFQEKYKERLTQSEFDWNEFLSANSNCFTIDDNIIFYTPADEAQYNSIESISSESSSKSSIVSGIPAPCLPWDEDHWGVFITSVNSTTSVWARIIGPEYSAKLDSLTTDIEIKMMEKGVRPMVTVNGIYLVCEDECWYRVRVTHIDISQNACQCFYIDEGDEEWVGLDQLFICDNEFLKLPEQAIQFRLFGLEDFEDCPNSKQYLEEVLNRKIMVATRNQSNRNTDDPITVVLYDTSTSDDINVNDMLLDGLCERMPPPQLQRKITHVKISNILDDGNIFCHLLPGIEYINKLIRKVVESKVQSHPAVVNIDGDEKTNKYLFYVKQDNSWYRGVRLGFKNDQNQIEMFCVDYGFKKIAQLTDVYQLDRLSKALYLYPHQALKVQLHDIPSIDDSIVSLMRGYLNYSDALVRIKKMATVPEVECLIWSQDGKLNCVNGAIRAEYELISLKEDIPIKLQIAPKVLCDPAIVVKPASSMEGLPKLIEYPLPNVGETLKVEVVMASSPSNFIVRPYEDPRTFHNMMSELQIYCSNNFEYVASDIVKKDECFAALHSDNRWYRVIVANIFGSEIHCSFCDTGDYAVVETDKLKSLPLRFRSLPKQAIRAKLFGICPKGEWKIDDCSEFQRLTVGKPFWSQIKRVSIDEFLSNQKILEIFLIDVSTSQDVYIHQTFVTQGRAIPSEETGIFKKNH